VKPQPELCDDESEEEEGRRSSRRRKDVLEQCEAEHLEEDKRSLQVQHAIEGSVQVQHAIEGTSRLKSLEESEVHTTKPKVFAKSEK
jgi:hypothetical protein